MPTLCVTKSFEFSASHFLTDYHGKCEHLHGHNYQLHVTVEGPLKKNGLVIDFLRVKEVVKQHVLEPLDHTHLNDRFENPSAENVVVWIWERLSGPFAKEGVNLKELKLWETSNSSVAYTGSSEP